MVVIPNCPSCKGLLSDWGNPTRTIGRPTYYCDRFFSSSPTCKVLAVITMKNPEFLRVILADGENIVTAGELSPDAQVPRV